MKQEDKVARPMAPSQVEKMLEIFKATLLENFHKLDSDAIGKMIQNESLADDFLAFVVERIGLDNTLLNPKPKQAQKKALSKKELVALLLSDVDEFNTQRPQGKIDLRGITFKTNINISKVKKDDFPPSGIYTANLSIANADLHDSDLSGSVWEPIVIDYYIAYDSGTSLIIFSSVSLEGANFKNANLTGCTIKYNNKESMVSFNGSDFSNATFDGIVVEPGTTFHGCIFTGSNASSQEFFKDRTKDALRGCQW